MIASNVEERKIRIERLHRAMDDACVNGEDSSEYFLDKCGAEAGDVYEPVDEKVSDVRPTRSPWAVIFGDSWLGRLIWH
jgi:hypothetical protein